MINGHQPFIETCPYRKSRPTFRCLHLTVPTATFRSLYCFIILSHERRQVVHFNVTEHPAAIWTARQMIEALPDDTAPRFLLRDRDSIYGNDFQQRVAGMRIEELITAPHSPWQNPYAERVIGSIRRECLDHVSVKMFPNTDRRQIQPQKSAWRDQADSSE